MATNGTKNSNYSTYLDKVILPHKVFHSDMNNEINFLPLFQVEPLAGGGVHTDVDVSGPALQDQFVGGGTPHDQCILIEFFVTVWFCLPI